MKSKKTFRPEKPEIPHGEKEVPIPGEPNGSFPDH